MLQPALRLDVRRRPLLATIGAYVRLTKPRVIELLLVTAVPPMILAQGGMPSLWLIAAVVLGGVSMAGGVGGVFGPIVAVVVLQLIRDDMTFLQVNPNYGLVAQGVILIGVLMVGSLVQMRRGRA